MSGGSPKRLRLSPSQEKFNLFNADQMMQDDRYSFAKTVRNRNSELRHPPKVSPRKSNRSVDPLTKNKFLLGQTVQKNTKGQFAPFKVMNAFDSRGKLSMQQSNAQLSQSMGRDGDMRMTSKYNYEDSQLIDESPFNKDKKGKTINRKQSPSHD